MVFREGKMQISTGSLTPVSLRDDGKGKKIIIVNGVGCSIRMDDVRSFFAAADLCNLNDFSGIYVDVFVPDVIALFAQDAALRRNIPVLDEIPSSRTLEWAA